MGHNQSNKPQRFSFVCARTINAGRHWLTKMLVLAVYALALALTTTPTIASAATDTDGDGIIDTLDNCRAKPNPNQLDSDDDDFGNVCDADYDNDNLVDDADFDLFIALWDDSDPSADLNGDGLVTSIDFDAFIALYGNPPGPGAAPNFSTVTGRVTDIAGTALAGASVTPYANGAAAQTLSLLVATTVNQ